MMKKIKYIYIIFFFESFDVFSFCGFWYASYYIKRSYYIMLAIETGLMAACFAPSERRVQQAQTEKDGVESDLSSMFPKVS